MSETFLDMFKARFKYVLLQMAGLQQRNFIQGLISIQIRDRNRLREEYQRNWGIKQRITSTIPLSTIGDRRNKVHLTKLQTFTSEQGKGQLSACESCNLLQRSTARLNKKYYRSTCFYLLTIPGD